MEAHGLASSAATPAAGVCPAVLLGLSQNLPGGAESPLPTTLISSSLASAIVYKSCCII